MACTAARVVGSIPFLGVVVGFLISFPSPLSPAPSVDASWVIGLQMAVTSGLDFGTDIVFTYGPLGYLDNPQVAFDVTAVTAAIYGLAGRVGLGIALVWVTRERFGLALGLVLAVAVALTTTNPVIALSLAALLGLVAAQPERPPWMVPVVLYGGAGLAAVAVLVKLNLGLALVMIAALAAISVSDDRWRNILRFGATFAIAEAVLWFATGQGLGNVGPYLSSSFEIISGYSAAMSIDQGAVSWDLAAALIAIAAVLAATAWTTRERPTLTRVASLAIVAVLSFTLFKQGFVRHAAPALTPFFGALAAAWVALPWARTQRPLAAVGCLALFVVAIPAAGLGLKDLDPVNRVEVSADQLRSLVDPNRRGELRDQAAERMRLFYDLDQATLEAIDDLPVAIFPWEAGIAWAYALNWDPLPVFQSYVAYTPALDRKNATALLSADGPQRVLRHTGAFGPQLSIDGRVVAFDTPATTLALLCNFRALNTTVDYQVLGRAGDRCGAERPLETVEAGWGEVVDVPPAGPGEAVLVRVDGLEPGAVERLENVVYRGPKYAVALAIDDGSFPFRFAPSTGATGLLLEVSPELDFPTPYNLALNPTTIAFQRDGGGGGELELDFYAVPIAKH